MRTMQLAAAIALASSVAACARSTVANESGARLTLAAPRDRSVAQGENCPVDLSISRKGVEGPVAIRFEGLPRGVSVVESASEIPAGADKASFTLHADNDAGPVEDRTVTVTAAAETGMSVSEQFKLRVAARQ